MDDQSRARGGTGELPLPAEAQVRIGNRLRSMYRDIVAEPIPDRFLSLLEQLNADRPGGASSSDMGEGGNRGSE